jgi:uncharacterized protein YecT (DUF1311 family)
MISFSNLPCFVRTIFLLMLTTGCTSVQLTQDQISQAPQQTSTSTNLATEPAQAATAESATLISSNKPVIIGKNCLNLAKTQTSDCSQAEQSLDQAYQQLVSQLGGASREKLINSQVAWMAFAETQCSFETRGFDRSRSSPQDNWAKPALRGCLDTMSQQRTQDLKRYLNFNP